MEFFQFKRANGFNGQLTSRFNGETQNNPQEKNPQKKP
jgi:hypothetical protein